MFLNPAQNARRLPVLLLTGFLGSGKTTLVNRLLGDERLADTAVAINEFGEVPLDHHLIEHGRDRTVVMANGCLCCNVAGDMEDAVMRIFSLGESGGLPRFRRLIVEPSGLADPAPIAQAILRNPIMSRVLRLEGIVTAVDALFAEMQLARQPESLKQVTLADRLVLTKTDLADAPTVARVKALLATLNPAAPILEAAHGAVDPIRLLPAGFLHPEAPAEAAMVFDAPAQDDHADHAPHTEATVAVSLLAEGPLRWRELDAWLRRVRIDHAEHLLRLKGLFHLAESAGPVVVQGVHHVMHAPVELARWPDEDRRSRLVLILRGRSPDAIRAGWAAALPRLRAEPAPTALL